MFFYTNFTFKKINFKKTFKSYVFLAFWLIFFTFLLPFSATANLLYGFGLPMLPHIIFRSKRGENECFPTPFSPHLRNIKGPAEHSGI